MKDYLRAWKVGWSITPTWMKVLFYSLVVLLDVLVWSTYLGWIK